MLESTEIDHIAENDELRSNSVRQILHEGIQPASQLTCKETSIPKILVQYWHDAKGVPEDVQECIDSWAVLEKQGFARVFFNDLAAKCFIDKQLGSPYRQAYDHCHHPAMRCDYFRLCYLVLHGGFYVDVDEKYLGADYEHLFRDSNLKVHPLCYDLNSESMVETDVMLNSNNYSKDWIYYFNNSALIAPPEHPVLCHALDRATRSLMESVGKITDIQSTTGPGNLTACLVRHILESQQYDVPCNVLIMRDWELISKTQWFLGYREDERNWRLWNPQASEGTFQF